MLLYTRTVKSIVTHVSTEIEGFVVVELARFDAQKTLPMALIVSLVVFIPLVAYVTLQATTSMFKYECLVTIKLYVCIIYANDLNTRLHLSRLYYRFSDLYDERVETYKKEKKKTEKLLTDLLPRSVIRQMKRVSKNRYLILR